MSDTKHATDTELDERLGELSRAVEPLEDLWPAIEAAIRADRAGIVETGVEAALERLPEEVSPPAEIWTGIARGIERAQPPARTTAEDPPAWSRLVASLTFVAIVAFALLRLGVLGEPASPDMPSDRVANGDTWLLPDVFATEGALPSAMPAALEATRQIYLEQIATVRAERETIEDSLLLYPYHPALRALWRHTYETELRLIDEAGRVLTTI